MIYKNLSSTYSYKLYISLKFLINFIVSFKYSKTRKYVIQRDSHQNRLTKNHNSNFIRKGFIFSVLSIFLVFFGDRLIDGRPSSSFIYYFSSSILLFLRRKLANLSSCSMRKDLTFFN